MYSSIFKMLLHPARKEQRKTENLHRIQWGTSGELNTERTKSEPRELFIFP